MGTILKSRWFRLAAALAGLLALYAWVGFKLVPGLLRSQATDYVRETYGRELALGEIRTHPFKLQLEVTDFALPDADGQTMLGLRRLFVDFDISSIWRRALVFSEVSLDAPVIRAVIRPDGAMNLADLAPAEAGAAESAAQEEDSALPRIWIESLDVSEGRVGYADLSARRKPFTREFAPVAFSLKDFKTTPEGGDFNLSARSGSGEQFDWRGRFALAPAVKSEGEFSITGLEAPGVADFLGDALPFEVSSGSIDLAGSYRVALGKTTELDLTIPKLALSRAGLRAAGVAEDWISLPSLVVSGTTVSLPANTVAISRIDLAGTQVRGWLSADGSLNLARFAGPSTQAQSATAVPPVAARVATPVAGAAAAPAAAGRPWSVSLAEIALTDATLDFEDRSKPPVKKFRVAPLALNISNASLDLAKPLRVSASAGINDRARVAAAGILTPEPLAAELDISVADARLQILQPYILPLAALTVRSGTLGATGKLRIAPPSRGIPELSFDGDLAVDGFRSTDNALGEDLVNFGRVRVQKMRYTMSPDALSIDRIGLTKPYARLIIGPEGVTNLATVLDPRGSAVLVEERRRAAAAETAASSGKGPLRKAVRAKRAPKDAAKKKPAAPAPGTAKPTAPTTEGMPIRIREVRIEEGRLNFSDQNVRPSFAADIIALDGQIKDLSSAFASRATVDLKGKLGEFSPVVIGGTIQPFAFDRHTDVSLDFRNISLPLFNPYSGRFAGYNIAKGKLETQLRYRIEDRQLKADHKIRIDQLEWGEASGQRGEATLPVKFATALLRDRNGVISLDIPVGGTLDDPKLRVGPIIWQIIRNLIVKAVTAPFALIGSLFKGAEQAQYVEFAPGEATLQPDTAERLGALAKGLVEKKGINLDVPIGAAEALDRPALAERAYREDLTTATRSVLKLEAGVTDVPAFATLPGTRRIEILTAMVRARTGSAPTLPEPPEAAEGLSREEAREAQQQAAIDFLEKAARGAVVITDADLFSLGQARGIAIERALLGSGELEPSRVFLSRNGKVAVNNDNVRFELGLK